MPRLIFYTQNTLLQHYFNYHNQIVTYLTWLYFIYIHVNTNKWGLHPYLHFHTGVDYILLRWRLGDSLKLPYIVFQQYSYSTLHLEFRQSLHLYNKTINRLNDLLYNELIDTAPYYSLHMVYCFIILDTVFPAIHYWTVGSLTKRIRSWTLEYNCHIPDLI